MELGKINTLTIDRNTPPGLFLVDQQGNDVLLPGKYIPENYELGNDIDVFVYLDNLERYIATTLKPFIQLHDFGWLRVNQVTKHGAFLELGIEKDLFVSFKEQARPMQEGKSYLVYMYLDEQTNRLTGTSKINKYLGLAYGDQVFKDIRVGDRLKGIVNKIREDNKIDISLHQTSYRSIEPNAELILTELEKNDGYLNLTDKSDPEDIKELLQMSKKSFKKAIGSLYKNGKVILRKDGIYLKN